MITTTLFEEFPTCPTYGFTSQPDYLVKITQREGGYERRDRKWSQALHTYDGVPLGDRPQADIEAIVNFWHAMGGMAEKFRFKDWADYSSGPLDMDTTPLDQPIIIGDGSPSQFQLNKQYLVGSKITNRTIQFPNGATIRVANEAGIEQASSAWTLEEDTGILTPNGGFVGTPNSWGGEFFVPCRFNGPLKVEISNFKILTLSVSIIEVRPAP